MTPTSAPPRPPAPPAGGGAAPHPRIRQRQIDLARHAGRRRLRRINVVHAVVCLAVWTGVVLRSPLVDVDRVQVDGAVATDPAAVVAASGVDRGDPMVSVDLGAAGRRVAALPWVDDVRVLRRWPGTVRVVVTERRAVATVAHPAGWATLDDSGRVLAVTTARPGLPVIAGRVSETPGASVSPEVAEVAAVVAALPESIDDGVRRVTTGDDGVELELSDGFVVVVGDTTDLDDKVASALAVRDHVDGDDGCRIDARVPRAPVLTSGGDCA